MRVDLNDRFFKRSRKKWVRDNGILAPQKAPHVFGPADEKTFQDLVDLHPQRDRPYEGLSGGPAPSELSVSTENLSLAIWLSSKGTAAGITGWR